MSPEGSIDHHIPTTLISGELALERIGYEAATLGLHKAVVICDFTESTPALSGLRKALSGSVLTLKAVCKIRTAQELEMIQQTCSDQECDALIALGSGQIQSLAREVAAAQGSAKRPRLISILDEGTDGFEATCSTWIGETIKSDRSQFSDMLILDPVLLGRAPKSVRSSGVIISLFQLSELLATERLSPQVRAFATKALQLINTHRKNENSDALSLLTAAVLTQWAYSSYPVGSLGKLVWMLASSGLCSSAEAAKVISGPFLRANAQSLASCSLEQIKEGTTVGELLQELIELFGTHIRTQGKEGTILSMVRQTKGLLQATDTDRLLGLMDQVDKERLP